MIKDRITLAHGGGGRLTNKLIADLIVGELGNGALNRLDDSAVLAGIRGGIAFTTDSYVVQPIFFRGGDIGKLAVCGTVNDLSMNGARPLFISLGMIIEEGFAVADLKRIISSVGAAVREAKVRVVCGDTKVVDRGKADGIFINTSGIGSIAAGLDVSSANARPGDVVLLSGPIGDHGIAVLSERKGIEFRTRLGSDCAPLNGLVGRMLASGARVRSMKDPTRGGLAGALNDIARRSRVGIEMDEDLIPVREEVRGACELLGLDPLYVANEGKLVAIVKEADASKALRAMRGHRYGRGAKAIGRVVRSGRFPLVMRTSIGGARMVEEFSGEQLPRIC